MASLPLFQAQCSEGEVSTSAHLHSARCHTMIVPPLRCAMSDGRTSDAAIASNRIRVRRKHSGAMEVERAGTLHDSQHSAPFTACELVAITARAMLHLSAVPLGRCAIPPSALSPPSSLPPHHAHHCTPVHSVLRQLRHRLPRCTAVAATAWRRNSALSNSCVLRCDS